MNQDPRNYFVTAISTDSGKSLVSAILVEALGADYWKPVQAGRPTDSDYIRGLVGSDRVIHKESYLLETPMSPHAAAEIEGIEVDLVKIEAPITNNNLIIEGAGGVMVPLNDEHLIIDIVSKLDIEVVLVSNNYLGSINHTLLTIEMLKSRNIKIKGIIFNGDPVPTTEDYILKYSGVKCLGKIPKLNQVNKEVIKELSKKIEIE